MPLSSLRLDSGPKRDKVEDDQMTELEFDDCMHAAPAPQQGLLRTSQQMSREEPVLRRKAFVQIHASARSVSAATPYEDCAEGGLEFASSSEGGCVVLILDVMPRRRPGCAILPTIGI